MMIQPARVQFTERERQVMYGAVTSQRLRLKRTLLRKAELGAAPARSDLIRMTRLERICDKLTALQAETNHGAWVHHGKPTTRPVKTTEAVGVSIPSAE